MTDATTSRVLGPASASLTARPLTSPAGPHSAQLRLRAIPVLPAASLQCVRHAHEPKAPRVLKAARGSGWLFRAIYAFHAAKIWNILDVPARFSPPAHVVTLERN
jgi:hypothetical protein